MDLETVKLVYIIFFIIAGLAFGSFVILAFVFDIKLIISILSGSKARKEVKRIRQENRRKNYSYINAFYMKNGKAIESDDVSGEELTTYLEAVTTYLNRE